MGGLDISFFNIRLLDVIDIVLVAVILYYIYGLIRGTIALNIFLALGLIFLVSRIAQELQMDLLAPILSGFFSIGPLALVVVFQQEIRRFLIHLGRNISMGRRKYLFSVFVGKRARERDNRVHLKPIIDACRSMSKSHTGALLVFSKFYDEEYYQTSGEYIDAHLSKRLLETIFQKQSPLHDGAAVIVDFKIKTAGSVLPLSDSEDLPLHFGLRHRAAIGVTEVSDAIAVVVSEETGQISFAKNGNVNMNITHEELEELLNDEF